MPNQSENFDYGVVLNKPTKTSRLPIVIGAVVAPLAGILFVYFLAIMETSPEQAINYVLEDEVAMAVITRAIFMLIVAGGIAGAILSKRHIEKRSIIFTIIAGLLLGPACVILSAV